MNLSTTSVVLMSIGTILAVLFIYFVMAGKKYDSMIASLNNKEFPLCGLYGVGLAVLDTFKHNFASKSERKRRQQIALLYGDKYSEYYLRINAAQRVTFSFLLAVVGFAFYGLSNEIMMLGVFALFVFVAWYYYANLPKTILEKKTNQVLNDFADVVSKLALLVNAGMIMREAWEKVAYTGDSEIYQEMKNVIVDINNGVSEIDAYTDFGMRCTSPEIKKFTSTIIQGMVKGNRELVEMIKQQSREIWDAKRHRVKQQGEKAASKLLIPICIMFIGILIMIIVPIFANLT